MNSYLHNKTNRAVSKKKIKFWWIQNDKIALFGENYIGRYDFVKRVASKVATTICVIQQLSTTTTILSTVRS